METELDWRGFTTAIQYIEKGIRFVDNPDDYAAFVREHPNTVLLPQVSECKLDTAQWRILLGYGFKKVILNLRNKARAIDVIRSTAVLLDPPWVVVPTEEGDIAAYEWLARAHVKAAGGDTKTLLEVAYEFDKRVVNPLEIAKVNDEYSPIISDATGLIDEELLDGYESHEYRRKQLSALKILQDAHREGDKKLLAGDTTGHKALMQRAYSLIDKVCKDAFRPSLQTIADAWGDFAQQISKWRNRPIIGFETDMPLLTNCLMGLRGLVLLGSEPNLGKTILGLQFAVQALRKHPDACCVFLSLEMYRDELITRAACAEIQTTWRDFVTYGTDEKLEKAHTSGADVFNRLAIVDREELQAGEEGILSLIVALQERTKCLRMMVVVDYLQVWEIPQAIEETFKSEQDADRYRMEAMKRLKRMLKRDDALIVITEVRKQNSNRTEKLTNDDLMGSARLAYAADTVLLWQNMTKADKYEWLIPLQAGITARTTPIKSDNAKKEEIDEHVKATDEKCQILNLRPAWLQITKGRDGTNRKSIPITAYYDELSIREGFLTNGSDGKPLKAQGEKTNDNDLDAIFEDSMD